MRICEICKARFRGEPALCPLDGGNLVPVPDPYIGLTLGGRYRIIEKIGAGGMGTVYRANHEVLGREVAVKFLAPQLAADAANRTRFLREARAANRINHEHIVDITDYGETDDGNAFLVMELLDGMPLNVVIAQGPLSVARSLRIGMQVAQALARAHELDVVHRDIKPENIFLLRGYDGDFVKLLDFGLAHMKGELRVTATGTVFGTPEYMAPEQARGVPISPSVDLYALGCVIFEMMTGVLPFHGTTTDLILKHLREAPPAPSSIISGVPPVVDLLVLSLLSKEAAHRPVSALALVDEIKRALKSIRSESQPPRALLQTIPDDDPGAHHPTVRPEDVWEKQVQLFRRLLRETYPERAPGWLHDAIEEMGTRLVEVRDIRDKIAQNASILVKQEGTTRSVRLRLGHAVDELARDELRVDQEIRETEERLRELRQRREDLAFQLDQLKGRLASVSAENEVDQGDLREETDHLDQRLQQTIEALAKAAEPVARHLLGGERPTPRQAS